MLGAWGPRTVDGKLYTMRNLDWAANTGIADNKLITIFHPVGKRAHATIGFAGITTLCPVICVPPIAPSYVCLPLPLIG